MIHQFCFRDSSGDEGLSIRQLKVQLQSQYPGLFDVKDTHEVPTEVRDMGLP